MAACPVALAIDRPDLALGILEAVGVTVGPATPALDRIVAGAIAATPGPGDADASLRAAVRDLLRAGGFKPTGRNKPSSEYIANAAARGAFPRINNVVDVANLVSVESGLPISLLDLDRARGEAPALEIRLGHPGETYAFNASGQEIDIAGLLSVAPIGGPAVGNPVKDAMVAKTDAATKNVVALVYAPRSAVPIHRLEGVLLRFAELLEAHAGAAATEHWVLPGA